MFTLVSHALGFLTLLTAAIYDLKTTEVPDWVSIIGVVSGLTLHGVASYTTGSLTPLMWCLGVGLAFSIYGWGLYYYGMWGGADAFAMSVLGFTAPYGLSGQSIMHPVNLFINLMIVGFLYTLGFAIYKAARSDNVLGKTWSTILEQETRVAIEIILSALAASIADIYLGLNGLVYFGVFLGLIFLYRFLKVLESQEMTQKVDVSELEVGDVIERDEVELSSVREKNFVGITIAKIRDSLNRDKGFLSDFEERYGYSYIVGVTEEEIENLKNNDVEKVDVRTGVRFVPAYPVALAITDIYGLGMGLLVTIV